MSAVTAAILVGSTPRMQDGINPRWIALLHEGRNYAWQLLHLQLTPSEVFDSTRDDPPGVLWRASEFQDLAGELALLLHLYATRTPEVVQLARRIRHIQRRRVDLAGLVGAEKSEFENLLRIAKERGRELRLAAHIYPGSRLTDEHLLSMPDWELEVGYSAFSRDWVHSGGGRLVIREHGGTVESGGDPSDDDEGEFAGERAAFIARLSDDRDEELLDAHEKLARALRNSDMTIVDDEPEPEKLEPQSARSVRPPSGTSSPRGSRDPERTTPLRTIHVLGQANTRGQSSLSEEHSRDARGTGGDLGSADESNPSEEQVQDVRTRALARTLPEKRHTSGETAGVPMRPVPDAAVPVTGLHAESPWGERGVGSSAAAYATVFGDVDAWLERDDRQLNSPPYPEAGRRSLFGRLRQRS